MNKQQKITGCITTLLFPVLGVMYFIGSKQDDRTLDEKFEDENYESKTLCVSVSDYVNSVVQLGGIIIDDIKVKQKHKKYNKLSTQIEKLEKKRDEIYN